VAGDFLAIGCVGLVMIPQHRQATGPHEPPAMDSKSASGRVPLLGDARELPTVR